MIDSITPRIGAATSIRTGGDSLVALYGPLYGGYITNPSTTADQGIKPLVETSETVIARTLGPLNTYAPNVLAPGQIKIVTYTIDIETDGPPENLYLSTLGPAPLEENYGTIVLYPGGTFSVPENFAGNIWVNAPTTGHKFTAVSLQPSTVYPPVPPPASAFPPPGPTNQRRVIPSYLYDQYNNDDDLQALVTSYNEVGQVYVDWFNEINLPIYTGLSDGLLDWVAAGLYGMLRPVLSSGKPYVIGPINTYALNVLAPNQSKLVGPIDIAATTDDVFKRILTWHFFKGDGKYFVVEWLKRRIYRFLFGANGLDAVGPTDLISVTFGADNELTITIAGGTKRILGGSYPNGCAPGSLYAAPNVVYSTYILTPQPVFAAIFQEAVNSGALEMPFQYNVIVQIGV